MTDVKMPRGWKAIEMPPDIAALPRDEKGFPIPYVAEWSDATRDYTGLDIRVNYALATCTCKAGVGVPVLGAQCPMRNRECFEQRKCQVCGISISEDEDCAFIGGAGMEVYWEPPLHLVCAAYSLQVCPGITRRPGVRVAITRNYELYDRFEYGPDGSDVEFVPEGQVPLLVQIGLKRAVFTYHGGAPLSFQRMDASRFIELMKERDV